MSDNLTNQRKSEVWYTKAIFGRTIGNVYNYDFWACPSCNYHPGGSDLPHDVCYNCGLTLKTNGLGKGISEVLVQETNYGYSRVRSYCGDAVHVRYPKNG